MAEMSCLRESLPAADPGSGGRPSFHHDGKTKRGSLDSRHHQSPGLSPDRVLTQRVSPWNWWDRLGTAWGRGAPVGRDCQPPSALGKAPCLERSAPLDAGHPGLVLLRWSRRRVTPLRQEASAAPAPPLQNSPAPGSASGLGPRPVSGPPLGRPRPRPRPDRKKRRHPALIGLGMGVLPPPSQLCVC